MVLSGYSVNPIIMGCTKTLVIQEQAHQLIALQYNIQCGAEPVIQGCHTIVRLIDSAEFLTFLSSYR